MLPPLCGIVPLPAPAHWVTLQVTLCYTCSAWVLPLGAAIGCHQVPTPPLHDSATVRRMQNHSSASPFPLNPEIIYLQGTQGTFPPL